MLSLAIPPFFFMTGCSRSTDVTTSSDYGFASFSGTVWKTKVKLAIAEITGEKHILAPERFDRSHPDYYQEPDWHIMYTLPTGTELRIDRLLKDNGVWGGVWVTGTVTDGAKPPEVVRVDGLLLANNVFNARAPTRDTTWAVNPDMLEKK